MRARINDRLARAARFPVTLIVAPAGFGKSVALRDFMETARLEAVRYDVRRDDATLLAFVRGLCEALEPLVPGALAAYPAAQLRVMASLDPVRELADWLAEHLRRTVCTIVIDDLHNAAVDPDSVALLAALIERTSGRITWIVATRSDEGLPVASWIGYGRMDVPLGEDELRFTVDEALAAADEAQAAADPHEVETLRELTGGWPIALGIALRMRLHAADLRSAASGTREMVYRYLAEQVFAELSRAEQRFLLGTCVFTVFDAALAEAYGGSGEMLAQLRRRATFLTATGSDEYRYHDLFRDFLEHELRRGGAAEWFDTLVRAGALLEGRGEAARALALFVRAGSVSDVLRVVERDGFVLFERGAGEALGAALDVIPDAVRRDRAAALGLRAMLEASRGNFDVAEAGFLAAIERADDAELRITLVHRYAIELVRHERDPIALLEPYAAEGGAPLALRVPILGTLATAYLRAGRRSDALLMTQRAIDLLEPLPDDLAARVYQQAAYVYSFAGPAERARSYATLAIEIALRRNLFEVAARAYSVLYSVGYEASDDPIATLGILDKLLDCARKAASRQARLYGLIASYELEVERGDDAALERLDRELDDGRGAVSLLRNETLLPAQALRAAWDGAFVQAYELLAGSAAHQDGDERRALRASEIALYACAAGLHDEGEAALREARDALERAAAPSRRVARSHLFIALAELVRGRATAAHRHAGDAERMLAPAMRRLRALANAVRAMVRVSLGQAEANTLAGALERLRAEHFGGIARLLAALPPASDAGAGYARLTPSEREILQLLAKGASSKDVAARTGRSPQTVDTHIRSICRKLQCSGRREAVAVAIGSGWVSV
ncbi:MAG: Regulatory protein LuxR:Tetratricopeptide 4 [Candidatus Eremiobacteraeota bacterium]|nr:Regulatory protein LuxR:Tetratricopeptide 4 [Candidatus Eremiobacteraeota bacterium]